MRRNVIGKVLSIVLSAAMVMTPAGEAFAASAVIEAEEVLVEAGDEFSEDGVAEDAEIEESSSEDLFEEPASEDLDITNEAQLSEDAEIEADPDEEVLMAEAQKLPTGATSVSDPVEMGANLKGQLYKWTDDKNKEHIGLYFFSENNTGFVISKTAETAFWPEHKTITDVIFGANITEIGYAVFSGCEALENITLPESLTTIGGSAFSRCSSLTSITIPKRVSKTDAWIFQDCTNLKTVTLTAGMTAIPDNILSVQLNHGYVETINIPSAATAIGTMAFYGQNNLKTVNFNGSKITKIGSGAFAECGMTQISIPDTVTTIESNAFENCSKLTSLALPKNLNSYGFRAFAGCSSITSITIPRKVVSANGFAFEDCIGLTEVTFEDGMTAIPAAALQNMEKGNITTINIPASVTSIGEKAFSCQSALKNVKFAAGSKLTTIENEVFYKTGIEGIDLPDTVTTIGSSAFCECSALENIDLPSSLTTLGYMAFGSCTALTSMLIPKKVSTCGGYVFNKCNGITEVTFEEGMTRIPDNILSVTENGGFVERVTIPSSVTEIGENAFVNQITLKNVIIKTDKLVTIGYNAFYNTGIEQISLPDSVKTIGYSAFANCVNLTGITLPSSLETLGYNAFYKCSGLTSITIPKNVKESGGSVFVGCTGLETVTFESGMETIPQDMLNGYENSYVRYVVLPSTIKTIKRNAFYNNKNIQIVYYTGSKESKKKITIEDGNDDLKNAEWIITKAVTGISLDVTNKVFYTEDLTTDASKEFTIKATVKPEDAKILDVEASYANTTGNAVVYATAGARKDNVTEVKVKLTGEAGKSTVTVRSVDGGFTAVLNVQVKEKEKAAAPYFVVNGMLAQDAAYMSEGDVLSIESETVGAQIFYGKSADEVIASVKYDDSIGRFLSNNKSVYEFIDELTGGEEITESRTIFAAAFKKDCITSAAKSVKVIYTALTDEWGDVAEEDRAQFAGDASKIPSGVWIPEKILNDESLVYSGSKLTLKDVKVYFGKTLLTSGKDYSVTYKNNVAAADKSAAVHPEIIVATKGNYGPEKLSIGFTIRALDITEENSSVTFVTLNEKANQAELKADPKLKVSGKALKLGTDYDLTITKTGTETVVSPLKEAGVYDITITGKGNYQGGYFVAKAIQVVGATSVKVSSLTISKPVNKTIPENWDGKDQSIFAQNLTVTSKGTTVTDGIDIIYSTVTAPGKATVTVAGNGKDVSIDGKEVYFVGSKTLTYTVSGSVPMKNVEVTLPVITVTFSEDGNELTGYVLKHDGKTLTEDVDYTVSYKDNQKAGKASVTFKGLKAYTGSVTKKFTIAKVDITKVNVLNENGIVFDEKAESYSFTKGGVKPSVSLEGIPESAYTVTYQNNKAVNAFNASKKAPTVKITAKGNYQGTVSKHFTITTADISKLKVSANNLLYSASPKKYTQTPVILDTDAAKLVSGKDFEKKIDYVYAQDCTVTQKQGKGKKAKTVSVSRCAGDLVENTDIIPAGTYLKLTVTGKGNYEGQASATYAIAGAKIGSLKFTVNGGQAYSFTGKEIRPGKSSITVQKKSGSSYVPMDATESYGCYDIVSYKNNVNKGTATITLKGKGDYAGTTTVTFKISGKVANK